MSSSIRGKRFWPDDRHRGRWAAFRLDQAPEVPLQSLRLPQLGVVQHDRSCALVTLQDCGYLRRSIENTSARETVSVHFTFSKGNNNNNNNLLHLSSAFLGTQSALHRRGNLLNHHQCAESTWMMRQQPYYHGMPIPETEKVIEKNSVAAVPASVNFVNKDDDEKFVNKPFFCDSSTWFCHWHY